MLIGPFLFAATTLAFSPIHRRTSSPPPFNTTIHHATVTLPLDHFASRSNVSNAPQITFENHYWVADQAYRPGGPVFLLDVGEGPAGLFAGELVDERSVIGELMREWGGLGVLWEHRFYGNSTPVPINSSTDPEYLRYLTTPQSLADLALFASNFSHPNITHPLTPDQTPWVMIGGSYSGMRTAFMRSQYPDTIFAGFASSAPVQARLDMSSYWSPIWRGMHAFGYGGCAKDIQAVMRWMDKLLDVPSASAGLKDWFLGGGAARNYNGDFAMALESIFSEWQYYGMGTRYEGGGLKPFCEWIEWDEETNTTAPEEGWAATMGAGWVAEKWKRFPRLLKDIKAEYGTECSGDARVEAECDLDIVLEIPDSVAWWWQFCTEWGYFRTAPEPDSPFSSHQLTSTHNDLAHWSTACRAQFPTANHTLVPAWPNITHTNTLLGGWHLRPSHVYWSAGEFDPWTTLSPFSQLPEAPKPRLVSEPPECFKQMGSGELFGHVIEGGFHVEDMVVGRERGRESREIFGRALGKWLGCFETRGGYEEGPGGGG